MPPENLRPPDLALDRLVDRSPDRDDPRSPNRRHLEILHEESVVADGSSKFIEKRGLVDVVSLEDDRARPHLLYRVLPDLVGVTS